jgi:plastocyanin
MRSRFRFAFLALPLLALPLLAVLSCNDEPATTQPPMTTPTPPGATATPAAATPTPPPATPTPTSTTASVDVLNNRFVDSVSGNSTTTVAAGSTVNWNFVSDLHSTTSGNCCTPDGRWDSGTRSTGTFSQTFSSAGTFPYFCTVHGSMMTGTVVVNP